MGFWRIGLKSPASARKAAKWAGFACLVLAARMMVGLVLSTDATGKPIDEAVVWFLGACLVPGFFVLAGVALLKAWGWPLGAVAIAIKAYDIVLLATKPPSVATVASLVTTLILSLIVANGVRGVLVLPEMQRKVSEPFE